MQQHTYAIMDRVEDSHWWFVGRRAILETFLRQIIQNPKSKIQNAKILDVGCGTGANLEMLSQFGEAEGVDVSDEALEFCRLVEDLDLRWFEEPCLWNDDRRAMRDIRMITGIPICAGQSEISRAGARDLYAEGHVR